MTALARVGPVGSRETERIRSEVRAEVGAVPVWFCLFMPTLPSRTIVGLNVQVCPTVPTYTLVIPPPRRRVPELEEVVHLRLHGRELHEDLVRVLRFKLTFAS